MDEELEKSNIYSGKVWDISSFLGLHPKGLSRFLFYVKGSKYFILSNT
jgi:cytochrome b involved in lipid metabolism